MFAIIFLILFSSSVYANNFNTDLKLDNDLNSILEEIRGINNSNGSKINLENTDKILEYYNLEQKEDNLFPKLEQSKDKESSKDAIDIKDLIIKEEDIPLKLTNLIYLVLERNNTTKQAFLNIKIAERKLAQQKSVYYPSISASYSYDSSKVEYYKEREESQAGRVNLSYDIFTFGRNMYAVKAMEEYLNSINYQYDYQVQDIIYQTIENYYLLLSLESKKQAALETELLSQETYKAASLKYKIGLVPLVDELKAKSSYSQSKLARIEVENEIKKQKAVINNLLNLDPSYVLYVENPEIDITGIDKDVKYYIEEAKKNRPDLKSLLMQKEQAIYNLKSTKAERYPTININGNVAINEDITNKSGKINSNSIGVGVSMPLFTGFSVTNDIKAQKRNIELLEVSIEQKKKDIAKEVWDVYQDFNTNQVSYFIARNLLETANENAKVSLGMYKNGKASILDVLDSQSQLESAKVDFINAKYNWLIYRMKLLKVIGKMNLENIINIKEI